MEGQTSQRQASDPAKESAGTGVLRRVIVGTKLIIKKLGVYFEVFICLRLESVKERKISKNIEYYDR